MLIFLVVVFCVIFKIKGTSAMLITDLSAILVVRVQALHFTNEKTGTKR